MRLVRLYNDHVEKISPVFTHHVRHSFVTAQGEDYKKKKKNIATQQFLSHESELTGKFGPQITNTYTKPKGLLVMRKSFLP